MPSPQNARNLVAASSLALGLVAAGIAAPSAHAEPNGPRALGEPIVLSTGQTGAGRPSVAYNATSDEFMAVWASQGDNSEWDLFNRRVAADGTLPDDIQTTEKAANDQVSPDIAYNPDQDDYFVTWQLQADPNHEPKFNYAFGKSVGADGGSTTEAVEVSGASEDSSLVYNPVTKEFVHYARSFGASDAKEGTLSRRISDAGQPVGEDNVVGPPCAIPAGDIAVNAAGGYLATWRDQCTHPMPVQGQLLNKDTSASGQALKLADREANEIRLAYDPGKDRYLSVTVGFGNPGPVMAEAISTDGTPAGSPTTVANDAVDARVVLDPVNKGYIVAWSAADGIWTRTLSADGAPQGEPVQLAAGTDYSLALGDVSARSKGDGGAVITWSNQTSHQALAGLVKTSAGSGTTS
ncbi:hypothetical protein [Luteipulveratus mongoliensis]|uniref:Uncharacterized protein n=1 Tax=Luteipulveratus mongoliensis TaxID=571913 RepID=A0A0K1JNA0_9MICO|nr:hypothetical protein [Luteipulveratus mongoliensis]AKU18181.1 hypothetical protein VV02_23895 [Luteipulveratus mongoliensis]